MRSGRRREPIYFGMDSMGAWMGMALVSLSLGIITSDCGYAPVPSSQPGAVLLAFRFLMTAVPDASCLAAITLLPAAHPRKSNMAAQIRQATPPSAPAATSSSSTRSPTRSSPPATRCTESGISTTAARRLRASAPASTRTTAPSSASMCRCRPGVNRAMTSSPWPRKSPHSKVIGCCNCPRTRLAAFSAPPESKS
ncbi:MAG: hypothetical protein KGR69_06920 [Verrucomicrobia bacterium]|nr:hypothetical protein [Verrucomicrobiota bacterium]